MKASGFIEKRRSVEQATPGHGRKLVSGSRHLITPEYPPQFGGVSDYTEQIAKGLALAGEEVHVWCPPVECSNDGGAVHIHRELGRFTPPDLREVGRQLDLLPAPRRILVQWVPHGFGYRSMNVGFCKWLWNRSRRCGDRIEIMAHEAFLTFEGSWRQYAAALVHRLMTVILLQASERAWVSIPRVEELWRPYRLRRRIPIQWLPVPSNVPLASDPARISEIRRRYANQDEILVGHFGTFGRLITELLDPVIVGILDQSAKVKLILIGPSQSFLETLLRNYPRFQGRIHGTGAFATTADPGLSHHISACDLMIQPYPDGVTSRRGSLMAGLNHGRAVVTTTGPGTEPIWFGTKAIAMVPTGDAAGFIQLANDLCLDGPRRAAMAREAQKLYESRFDIAHTVEALRAGSQDFECVS